MNDSQLQIILKAQNEASKTLADVQRDVQKLSQSAGKDLEKLANQSNNTNMSGLQSAMSAAGSAAADFGAKLAAIGWGALKAGIAAAVAQLGALGTLGIKAGSDLQKTQTGIIALTGSMDTANGIMKDFYQFAANTPLEFPDIAKSRYTR